MRYETGQIYDVPLEAFVLAKWNPAIRTDRIAPLAESIRDNGQLVPIQATPELRVVDGHRRLASLKEIGIPTARVLIVDGSQKEMYGLINSTQRVLSARESMMAYALGGPKSGSAGTIVRIGRLERAVGIDGMKKIADAGFGPGIDREVQWTLNNCGRDVRNLSDYRKVLNYFVAHRGASNYIRSIQDGNIRPKKLTIWRAIEANKDIQPRSKQQRLALRAAKAK
jgi:hypothetical protein